MDHELPVSKKQEQRAVIQRGPTKLAQANSGQGQPGLPLYLQRLSAPTVQRQEEEEELQAKLTLGASNDKYEQQADQVANQVMRMPDPTFQRQPEGEEEEELIQAKPLAESITPLHR